MVAGEPEVDATGGPRGGESIQLSVVGGPWEVQHSHRAGLVETVRGWTVRRAPSKWHAKLCQMFRGSWLAGNKESIVELILMLTR